MHEANSDPGFLDALIRAVYGDLADRLTAVDRAELLALWDAQMGWLDGVVVGPSRVG